MLLALCIPLLTQAQQYLTDAELIARYAAIRTLDDAFDAEVAKHHDLIIETSLKNSGSGATRSSIGSQQGDGGGGGIDTEDAGSSLLDGASDDEDDEDETVPAGESPPQSGFSTLLNTELTNELKLINDLIDAQYDPFKNGTFNTGLDDFPSEFKYLPAVVQLAEQQTFSTTAKGTSGGIGGLMGISQTEILQGITEWAISRAQEELMQAFLREWFNTLQEDTLLATVFPNTLNMLATSELTTMIADGNAWKATFQQDLDNIPANIRSIADAAIIRTNLKVEEQVKMELLATLGAGGVLYQEIGKGKEPDDVLFLLGQKAFSANADKSDEKIASIDRALVGLSVAMTSLRKGDGYVLPRSILSLSEEEAKILWCLTYLRDRDELHMALALEETRAPVIYKMVMQNIGRYRTDLASLTENITALVELVKNNDKNTLSSSAYHQYSSLTFGILNTGIEMLANIDAQYSDSKRTVQYEKYLKGIEHVSLINEAVMTKEYGGVVLHSVNLLTWTNDQLKASPKQRSDQGTGKKKQHDEDELARSIEAINKYGKLMANIILAEDKDDIKAALDEAAMKRGGYLVRQRSQFSATMTMLPGYEWGEERLDVAGNEVGTGSYMGLSLPIGVEVAMGTNWKPIGAIGIFLQVLDLGAIMNYSVNNTNDSINTIPEITFAQVFSPGAAFTVHLANNPITLGYSVTYSPSLRRVSVEGNVLGANALQHGIFIGVDLNVFPIYTSKKKFKMNSKSAGRSMQTAY